MAILVHADMVVASDGLSSFVSSIQDNSPLVKSKMALFDIRNLKFVVAGDICRQL